MDKDAAGKTADKTYLETGLRGSLQKAIDDYVQGEKEQADYMRTKYLFGDTEEEED